MRQLRRYSRTCQFSQVKCPIKVMIGATISVAPPKEVGHWSLTTLRERLVKIGAKVVRHGCYVTFRLAEVAVPRNLFREILRLIDGLRPRPPTRY